MTESNGLQTLGDGSDKNEDDLNANNSDVENSEPDHSGGETAETGNEDRAASLGGVTGSDDDVKVIVPPVNQAFQQDVLDAEAETVHDATDDPHLKEQEFTIVTHTDPARQADPHGVYLDDVQRAQAEAIRARVEGRKPDFKNPGTTASDVVVPTHVAKQNVDGNANVPVAFKQEVMVGANREDDKE